MSKSKARETPEGQLPSLVGAVMAVPALERQVSSLGDAACSTRRKGEARLSAPSNATRASLLFEGAVQLQPFKHAHPCTGSYKNRSGERQPSRERQHEGCAAERSKKAQVQRRGRAPPRCVREGRQAASGPRGHLQLFHSTAPAEHQVVGTTSQATL